MDIFLLKYINHLKYYHSTEDNMKGKFAVQLSQWAVKRQSMTISSQLLSPLLLISCWSLLFLHLLFCTVLLPFRVNQAIGKKQVLWEGKGKWAPARWWYSSDHLELHHLHNVSQYLWGFAGSSASQNSNLNTGIMEIHQNHGNTPFTCFSPLVLCSIFFFFS